jgi:hypothetical protein
MQLLWTLTKVVPKITAFPSQVQCTTQAHITVDNALNYSPSCLLRPHTVIHAPQMDRAPLPDEGTIAHVDVEVNQDDDVDAIMADIAATLCVLQVSMT